MPFGEKTVHNLSGSGEWHLSFLPVGSTGFDWVRMQLELRFAVCALYDLKWVLA